LISLWRKDEDEEGERPVDVTQEGIKGTGDIM
jgi:hypothetical protein